MKITRIGENALLPDEEETKWLLALMQNPIYDDETPSELRMRTRWFKALKEYSEALNPPLRAACGSCSRNQLHYNEEDDIPF